MRIRRARGRRLGARRVTVVHLLLPAFANGGFDIYLAPASVRRSGDLALMLGLFDFDKQQTFEGDNYRCCLSERWGPAGPSADRGPVVSANFRTGAALALAAHRAHEPPEEAAEYSPNACSWASAPRREPSHRSPANGAPLPVISQTRPASGDEERWLELHAELADLVRTMPDLKQCDLADPFVARWLARAEHAIAVCYEHERLPVETIEFRTAVDWLPTLKRAANAERIRLSIQAALARIREVRGGSPS